MYKGYDIDEEDFEFCSRTKCPLRQTCLRKLEPPFNSEYWSTGGNYNGKTCNKYINKNEIRKETNNN